MKKRENIYLIPIVMAIGLILLALIPNFPTGPLTIISLAYVITSFIIILFLIFFIYLYLTSGKKTNMVDSNER